MTNVGKKTVALSKNQIAYDNPDDYVFTPYIRKKGKIIWHPTGGLFVFPKDPNYKKYDKNNLLDM